MRVIEDPLISPPPKEIPLRNAPLVRVIAQVRFPEILSVEQPDFVAPFQEDIRATYPVLRQEQIQSVLISATSLGASSVQTKPQTAWRFHDVEGYWRLSLTQQFLALETTKYTSRTDFLARLYVVVVALEKHLEPKLLDRLGIRYIDRILGAAVDDIADLVHPEVRGIVGTTAATHATVAVSETMFEQEDCGLLARWGCLPANATIDAAAIEPAPEKSWILDLDMFGKGSVPFTSDRVIEDAKRYAERIYTFFRWAVTDKFLQRYGGKP